MRSQATFVQNRITDIRLLLFEGKTYKEIAEELGYKNRVSVCHFMKTHGIENPNPLGPSKNRKRLSSEEAIKKLKQLRTLNPGLS
jgi:AraC-like DNA-binding protein